MSKPQESEALSRARKMLMLLLDFQVQSKCPWEAAGVPSREVQALETPLLHLLGATKNLIARLGDVSVYDHEALP